MRTLWLTPCPQQCKTITVPLFKFWKYWLSQMRFSLIGTKLTNLWFLHVTHEAQSSSWHCTDMQHFKNTNTHTYTDFLFRVSVYVSVLGLQGFGMFLWTLAWDTQGQACHRMWGGCGTRVCLILPQTVGNRTYTHAQLLRNQLQVTGLVCLTM